ncbi:MAG: transcription-repair coupling factor [Actinobacteria bacterium]|nr:transcription-repair coupling factor [Actinomycetota bacterium]
MSLEGLGSLLVADPAARRWVEGAQNAPGSQQSLTAPAGAHPVVVALAADPEFGGRSLLVVTATVRAAEDLAAEIAELLGDHAVAMFNAWETLPHERLSPSADVVGQRLAVLRRLAAPDDHDPNRGPLAVVVSPVRALLQPIVAGLGDVEPVAVKVGDEVSPTELATALAAIGYDRTDLVERRGQFAVRGGIVDVFPPTSDHPVRLEFFGDEVEEVRAFAVADQRSLGRLDGLWAPVCRELLLTDEVKARAGAQVEHYPGLIDLLGAVAAGLTVEGMEAIAPLVTPAMETLVELVPPGSAVVVVDPERVAARAEELVATSAEFLAAGWDVAAGGGEIPVELAASAYRTMAEVRALATGRGQGWWELTPFAAFEEAPDAAGELPDPVAEVPAAAGRLGASPAPRYRGDLPLAAVDIGKRLDDGDTVIVVAAGHGSAQRLVERFTELDLPARVPADGTAELARRGGGDAAVTVTTARWQTGFVDDEARLVLLTESDLMGAAAASEFQRLPARRRRAVDPLTLTSGDFVVHEQHGVGRYIEMIERTVAGSTREYLVIEYAPSKRGQPPDRLFVPTDQLDQVSRYVGGEAPAVHRLGGADWQKAKGRARRAVRQIVDGLVKLYAARQRAPGRAFGPDTPWQRELEDAFPYQETPDQLACIDEVKADMAQPVPMDRVICGDVGFGKTEIAVRAAFKAVADGTQVIVLVPTTLLARQHLQTFTERFAAFPVKVAGLSRFTGEAEARDVLAGLADGSVDVVIGTHRLLGPKTKVKNLGLVIIDEEQRFGVEHKEHLKALRTNVDVLTMSATPIPRTLEMAVTGIREMSTIATPPEERLPVLTFVGPYNERQVAAAIRRELTRDGQVFFLHNRVASINKVAAKIAQLVPEARIAVAHGQMHEDALEKVMVDFWERSFDVLVSTTIVESGLDIPNANTLIVDRAERFGLSQLHQIRGRVGRGRERAYAYFFYDADTALTETAYERLSTIAQHTDLGSGMAVAMKDLEIRGAGNLLGGEQSGHIADVGFDLYVRMVGEALAEVKGETDTAVETAQTRVELPLDAHIPRSYVPNERLRLEAYRRLAEAADDAAVADIEAELADRYGRLPAPVQALVAAARLRIRLRSVGVDEIVAAGNRIRIEGLALPDSLQVRLHRLYPEATLKPASRTVLVPSPKTARVGGKPLVGMDLVAWVEEFVDAVAGPAGSAR